MAIPMNEMPNRLDQIRAEAEATAPRMPPAGGAAPMPTASPSAGRTAPMPMADTAPMIEEEVAATDDDRLAALMGGMDEEPMMPEEDPMADVKPQDLAVGIAQSALDISDSPEEALAAVEAAAAELRNLLA